MQYIFGIASLQGSRSQNVDDIVVSDMAVTVVSHEGCAMFCVHAGFSIRIVPNT
jgi:hypothetical protein